MSGLLIHTFDFESQAIDGSKYFVSKRVSDFKNTPRFPTNPNMVGYTPIGHGDLEGIGCRYDSPEARELYSCFAPLTVEELLEKKSNSWKYSYVEMPYQPVFPKNLPSPRDLTTREQLKVALDERVVDRRIAKRNVTFTVMQPTPEAGSDTGSDEPPRKKKRSSAGLHPMTTRTPRAPPQQPQRVVLFRPLSVDEIRAQERHMAAALAYITRVRIVGPNHVFT